MIIKIDTEENVDKTPTFEYCWILKKRQVKLRKISRQVGKWNNQINTIKVELIKTIGIMKNLIVYVTT